MVLKIHISSIGIAANRQRREFDSEKIVELADSVMKSSLLHPLVVRKGEGPNAYLLVAGERRLKAIEYVWAMGSNVRCGKDWYGENFVPCIDIGDLDSLDAMEAELDENIRRVDLSWQERATATAQLYELRRLQAEKSHSPPPTVESIKKEVRPDAAESSSAYNDTRDEILIARHLSDPAIANAKTAREGMKILKRKEELEKSRELGEIVGRTYSVSQHQLLKGDCIALMKGMESETFDVILTDPPYGIEAQEFNDSGGRTPGGHFYDDTLSNWTDLMLGFTAEVYRLAKSQAHAYIFCDVDNFVSLKDIMKAAGWTVFRTPLIWHNPMSIRAPWPEYGPQRKWQMCLYAIKGKKPVLRLAPDLVEFRSDENLNHPAQKPVGLFAELLKRSVRPGDTVLDPFAGSGTIFPACHELVCKATGIELDDFAYGIAVKRLGDLK